MSSGVSPFAARIKSKLRANGVMHVFNIVVVTSESHAAKFVFGNANGRGIG